VSDGAITANAEDIAVIGLKNKKDRRNLLTKQAYVRRNHCYACLRAPERIKSKLEKELTKMRN